MKISIIDLKMLLTKQEKLSIEQLKTIKGGCGNPNDPRRCQSEDEITLQKNEI